MSRLFDSVKNAWARLTTLRKRAYYAITPWVSSQLFKGDVVRDEGIPWLNRLISCLYLLKSLLGAVLAICIRGSREWHPESDENGW